jgi:uncharacterized membrane-anchored protein YitT (DUF2179 family)
MRAGMQLKRRLVIIRRLFMHEWQTFVVITIGALCFSGIISLTMPFRLPKMGVSGLAVLSNYVFGISPAWVIAIGNVGLLLWGMARAIAALRYLDGLWCRPRISIA